MRALVADSSATTRRVLIRALRVVGVRDVMEFADARTAAPALAGSPELVVVEWRLTDDDALALLTDLRARENGAGARVLVLSERNRRDDIERMTTLGIQGYLLKPFETRVLIEQLSAVMEAPMPEAEADAGTDEEAAAA